MKSDFLHTQIKNESDGQGRILLFCNLLQVKNGLLL